jgi:hypothetical protein
VKQKLFDHALSILVIAAVFILLFAVTDIGGTSGQRNNDVFVASLIQQGAIDLSKPFHRSLFKETLSLFYPNDSSKNDSLLQALDSYRLEQFTKTIHKSGGNRQGLSWIVLYDLIEMYFSFIFVYAVVIAVSYYAALTIAVYSFVKRKQQSASYFKKFISLSQSVVGALRNHNYPWRDAVRGVFFLFQVVLQGVLALILFAPAYIIAYSMKSTFESGGYLFMIILGIISNGLLMNSAYKFYTFLIHESRKGYVETAIAKGLYNSYSWNTHDGIPIRSLLKWKKSFPSHVLHHIYENARFQYIPTMKQHASFLVTGLIIIEMALNIQGHLCYELLQDILYKRYDVVLMIIFGIFMVVKITEIFVDYWFDTESRKYENES